MKKSITAAVVCALMLTTAACGKTQDSTENGAVFESVTEKPTDNQASDQGNLYEAFKAGTAKAKYRGTGDRASYVEISKALQKGQSYTMEEIAAAIESIDEYNDFDYNSDVEYSYIDCGQDGAQELLAVAQLSAEFRFFMIVKEIDGELVICYDQDAWSRCDVVVNSDGTIESSGSGGAAVHIVDYAYVDAAGDYKFYYGLEETLTLFGDYYAYTTGENYAEIPTEGLDQEHLGVRDYYFEADYTDRTHSHSYFILDDNYNDVTTDADYDDSNELKTRFTEAGIKTYTAAEIDQMLKDRASQIGYPVTR
jgi:hypothetical protein